jgi:hypothetical protein
LFGFHERFKLHCSPVTLLGRRAFARPVSHQTLETGAERVGASTDWLRRTAERWKGEIVGIVITLLAVIGVVAVVLWLMRRA